MKKIRKKIQPALALVNTRCKSRKCAVDGYLPRWICVDRWPSWHGLTQIGGAVGLSPTTVAVRTQVRIAARVAATKQLV